MPIPDSQGTTLTFNGRTYGGVTNISVVFANAGTYEYVPTTATVIRTGTTCSPRAKVMPGTVAPGTLTATGFGAWDNGTAGGEYGTLVVTNAGGRVMLNVKAILIRCNRELAVNDVVRSSLEFQISEVT